MNFSAMLVYMAVTAITPGPNNLMCMYLGATVRLKGAVKFLSGSMTGLFTKMLICGFLNVVLAEEVPKLVPYLKWLGAAYMLYLGFTMVREGFSGKENIEDVGPVSETQAENKKGTTFFSGILLQCLNVKSWVSAISIFSVYIIPYSHSLTAVVGASVAYLILILASSLAWVLFGQAIQGLYNKHKAIISLLMGISLGVCAVTAVL